MLCIEIDENQHKKRIYRESDSSRYNDLFCDFSGKYVFIRYNPDPYRDADGARRDPDVKVRMRKLFSELRRQMHRIEMSKNSQLLEIVHLFYDERSINSESATI
jgi:hypothetical protein